MSNPTRPDQEGRTPDGGARPDPEGADRTATPLPSRPDTTPTFDLAGGEGPPELPDPFGRYAVVRPLGRGGMGCVYLARDTQLDRLVALKVPHLAGRQATLRERFYREAKAAALLHHPNICPVYDVGAVGEIPYLTMAYIEGLPLHRWARSEPPPTPARVLALVGTLARALEEAHRRGVVHRDLKPSNVLVDHRGEPVVMDFGLALRLHVPGADRLTSPGLLLGTPAYMPPEYVEGQPEAAGPAGDVYSLGVILYELLTGQCPFRGNLAAVLAQVVGQAPPPPSRLRPDLDPRLDGVCAKAMAREPARRYASMAEFASALAEVGEPTRGAVIAPPARAETTSSGEGATPAGRAEPDPRLATKVLELLRTWGWARGVQKIKARARRGEPGGQRAGWQGYLDWLAGEGSAETARSLGGVPGGRALRGWALAGQASFLMRDRDYAGAQRLLERAEAQGDPDDVPLRATIAHTRAAALAHQGQCDEALPHLHRALDLFGKGHFMTGRVLDTLGMAYAYKGSFPVAREFYEQSIRYKESFRDEAGVAVSHGQLGRLYLDWGHLDESEGHFQEDLRLVQKIRSPWSEAQVYNHLGQVALARGECEARAGRRAAARRHWAEAAGWLEQSVRLCREGKFAVSEGFARKDRALVCLHEGDLAGAEEQLRLAEELFGANRFAEGLAKAQRVGGMVLRARQRWPEAERKLRSALAYFESTGERDEGVRTQLEIARTLRDAGAPAPLVTRAYREALACAESCRHPVLVQRAEQELHEVDPEAYLRHAYKRARGCGIEEDSPSLPAGVGEVATVLFVDLPGFSEFAHGLDPEEVLLTFNQLMADFVEVLSRYGGRVLAYRGNGLMALVREARHAERGVCAALDLVAALEEFNRPRRVLGLPLFHVRVGLSSGEVLLGNVGTYQKMDFTALGTAVNVAGALRNEARPGVPCVSRSTWEQVRERFAWAGGGPRCVQVAGFGACDVWDVVGRRG